MLVQLKVSIFRAISPAASSRKNALLMGALLLGGLGGCKFDDKRPTFTQSDMYKEIHPAEINSRPSDDAINQPPDLTMGSRAGNLPTLKPVDSELLQDDPLGHGNDGERATGWKGMYDVYWKLNWARKELLIGNVSHDLATVITSTRKHCKRLANEFPKLEGMDERLEVANSALDHLDSGLQQMNKLAMLEESGLQWRDMPWGSGVDEMHRYLERMGLVGPMAKASSMSTPLIENEDPGAMVKPDDARPYVTSRQRDAIALALRCEREYHSSPEELARAQFQTGMRDIIRLRDLCALTYHAASVPGDTAVITGSLHLEADSAIQVPQRFETSDKSTGSGLAPGFDPTAPPGQNSNTPLIR